MRRSYFKIRDRFNFSPHRFEIGNPLIQSRHFSYNHLFNKVYSLNSADYPLFYDYHLVYFLQSNPDQQQDFFAHFYRITSERIAYYRMQDPLSSKQRIYQFNIARLEAFLSFLCSIDQWHVHQPLEAVIAKKSRVVDQLTAENEQLKQQIRAFKEYEPSEKIVIAENHLGTFIDLIQQMQQLMLPENKKLLNVQSKSGWYKMLSRYFQHGQNTIPIETARNYFSGQQQSQNIKGTKVKNDHKLFKISNINPKT